MTKHLAQFALATVAVVAFAACGGGGAVATTAPTGITGTTPPPVIVEPVTPDPEDLAAQLQAAFTESLAATALDEPVNAADCGDVLPRPNGVYCHYSATADAGRNVEAQLKGMTRAEFDDLAETLHAEEQLSNVGEAAYKIEGSLIGGTGAFVMVYAGDRGVTVNINDDGDQDAMNQAAIDIALAALGYV